MCSPALQEGWQPPAAECAALIRPFQGRATKRLLLPLFAVAVQSLSGQDVPRLQARADSLVREWRRASALADMVDSLDHARAAGGTDTISVGALRIVTNPSPARLREAASRAWPVIDSLYGTEARQLAQRPYLIAPYDPDTTSPKPTLRGAIQVPWDQDVTSLAMILVTNVPIGQPDAACTELLRSLPPGVRPRPLTYDARAALVHIALRLGGREAYHRLIATPALPIPQRLAGAAGVSVDSLVSLWRAEILAARPAPVTVPPWGPWVALGWTAVFAVCALRSSRWRVS